MKPEIWQDEAIGHVGPWERLLFLGLITMADDEGRLRALPSAIAGHVFPYDDVSVRKVEAWLARLSEARLVVLYESGGTKYAAIKGWSKHQKVNRPAASEIPEPAAVIHGAFSERSLSVA